MRIKRVITMLAVLLFLAVEILGIQTLPAAAGSPPVPEPEQELLALGEMKMQLILIDFKDRKHSIATDELEKRLTELNSFLLEVSYGRMWISWQISRWYTLDFGLRGLSVEEWNFDSFEMLQIRREAIAVADPDIDFRQHNVTVILSAGNVWPHATCPAQITTGDRISVRRLFLLNEHSETAVFAHELGHVLPSRSYAVSDGCGLPDLYSYEAASKGQPSGIFVGAWDIMSRSDRLRHFSGWSKYMLGWLEPETIRLNPNKVIVFQLQPLIADRGIRLIQIALPDGSAYFVEARRKLGFDANAPGEGVVIYFVSDFVSTGDGSVRVVDATPQTKDLNDAQLKPDKRFDIRSESTYFWATGEVELGFTLAVGGAPIEGLQDSDGDGAMDYIEQRLGSNPQNSDTDGDGLTDGEEVNRYDTNPLSQDTDGDQLSDAAELQARTSPFRADTDGDGLSDGREVLELGSNPLSRDTDGDGLQDNVEVEIGTNLKSADTDGDGLSDAEELKVGTRPTMADTDNDGVIDSAELKAGTDPNDADSDDDGLLDGQELVAETDPLKADTDGDGLVDGEEVARGANPLLVDTDADYWADPFDPAPGLWLVPNGLIVAAVVAVLIGLYYARRRAHS